MNAPPTKEIAHLLFRLTQGWDNPAPPSGVPLDLKLRDRDITAHSRTLSVANNILRVECEFPANDGVDPAHSHSNAPRTLIGTLPPHYHVRSPNVTVQRSQDTPRSYPSAVFAPVTYDLLAKDWVIVDTSIPKPALWVAHLGDDPPIGYGNLTFKSPHSISSGHMCLRTSDLNTYLLSSRSPAGRRSWLLVLESLTPGPVDSLTDLRQHFVLLSVALGTPLFASMLVAYDSNFRPCGFMGLDLRLLPIQRGGLYSSPLPAFDDPPWTEPFFKALSDLDAPISLSRSYHVALHYFVDSLAETSLSSMHLKLFVALSTLSTAALDESFASIDPTPLTDWLDDRATTLEPPLAPLVERTLRTLHLPSATALIFTALDKYQLSISPEIHAALRSSDLIMIGKIDIPAEDPLRSLAVLRTVFIALLGKICGYSGPIGGWDHPFYPQASTWWPAHTDVVPEAVVLSIDQGTYDPLATTAHWPSFEPPCIPTGPIAEMDTFARALEQSTGRLIQGRMLPVPSAEHDGPRFFDFVLFATTDPRIRSTLFTATETGSGAVEVIGWTDDALTLSPGTELRTFLSDIAGSGETRRRIQLLMQASELSRTRQ